MRSFPGEEGDLLSAATGVGTAIGTAEAEEPAGAGVAGVSGAVTVPGDCRCFIFAILFT